MKIINKKYYGFIIAIASIGILLGCNQVNKEKDAEKEKIIIDKIIGKWVFREARDAFKYVANERELIPNEKESYYKNKAIIIGKKTMSFGDEIINNPIYKIDYYSTGYPEKGIVLPKSLSAFYGYKPERKYITQLFVFKDIESEKKSDYAFNAEIISEEEIVIVGSNVFIFYDRVK